MTHYFLNEDKTYRPCNVMEWANQFETMDRRVDETLIDNYRISTVWMGLNLHDFGASPLVFETMIFRNGRDIYCTRCSTWDEAKKQHEMASQWIKGGCKEDDDL